MEEEIEEINIENNNNYTHRHSYTFAFKIKLAEEAIKEGNNRLIA